MKNQLVNIALASAIYEQKRNYLDTYLPFIIKSFSNKSILDLKELSTELQNIFGISMPINSIKQLLTLNDNKYFQINKASRHHWTICLSKDGIEELNHISDNETKQSHKLDIFYNSLMQFAQSEFQNTFSIEEIKNKVQIFVIENLIDISIKKTNFNIDQEEVINGFEKIFINFLLHTKNTNTENTETFDDIWKGTIIWNELRKSDIEKEERKFEKTLEIYVDTNFILSLLEFHNDIINQAAFELLDLIKSTPNLELKVLDITLNELYDLLDVYAQFKDDYYEIEIDSAFYYLKRKGYNAVKIEKLKDELPSILKTKFNIVRREVDNWNQNELYRFSDIYNHLLKIRSERNERLANKLKKRDYSLEKSTTHDSNVINYVLKYKDKYAISIEKSKCVFLTSSFLLFKDYQKISNTLESVSSVLLDATLTNILYLKNPNSNPGISIDQVIKVHCKHLIIDRSIWALYIQTINELKLEENITAEDYTRLISKNQLTETYLLNASEGTIAKEEILEILEKLKTEDKIVTEKLNILSEVVDKLESEKQNLKTEIIDKEKVTSEKHEQIKILTDHVGSLQKNIATLKYENAINNYNNTSKEPLKKNLTQYAWSQLFKITWYLVFFSISIGLQLLDNCLKEKKLQ